MNYRRIDGAAELYIQSGSPAAERCNCLPPSSIQVVPALNLEEDAVDYHRMTPASPELNALIRQQLERFFPRSTALSLLLLHVSQLEQDPNQSAVGVTVQTPTLPHHCKFLRAGVGECASCYQRQR